MAGVCRQHDSFRCFAWPMLVMFVCMTVCPLPFCHSHDELVRVGGVSNPLDAHLKFFHAASTENTVPVSVPSGSFGEELSANEAESGWHIHWVLPAVMGTMGSVSIDGASTASHGCCDRDFAGIASMDWFINGLTLSNPSWGMISEFGSLDFNSGSCVALSSVHRSRLSLAQSYCNFRC